MYILAPGPPFREKPHLRGSGSSKLFLGGSVGLMLNQARRAGHGQGGGWVLVTSLGAVG